MTKMTDEELGQAQRVADYLNPEGTSTVHRLLGHSAALAAEREQLDHVAKELDAACPGSANRGLTHSGRVLWMHATHVNDIGDLRKERDALRERVTALEAEKATVEREHDADMRALGAARARLAAIRQRRDSLDPRSPLWSKAQWLVGDDAPAPSDSPGTPCDCGGVPYTHEAGEDCLRNEPSEMDGLRGEMAEPVACKVWQPLHPGDPACACGANRWQHVTTETTEPTTAEAFATVREALEYIRADKFPETRNKGESALSLLERRMGAMDAAARALIAASKRAGWADSARTSSAT